MEQTRLFMAIILSIIVFVVWDHFFVPKKPISQESSSIQESTQIDPDQSKSINSNQGPEISSADGRSFQESPPVIEIIPKVITVSSPYYTVVISEKGAFVQSFTLNDYFESKKTLIKKEMISKEITHGTLKLDLLNNSLPGLGEAFFQTDAKSDHINLENSTESISFTHTNSQGISVVKKFTFSKENYLFNLSITIINHSNSPVDDSIALSLTDVFPDKGAYGFEGPSALIDNKLEQVKAKKIKDKNIYPGKIEWIALSNRYFMSSIIPEQDQDLSMHLSLTSYNLITGANISEPANIIDSRLVQMLGNIPSGDQKTLSYSIYIGPKSVRILQKSGHQLDKAVHFGFFDFLAKPCLWIMNMFYSLIPNYGLAIIFLTVLVKLLFFPLGTKAYKSMNEMKKLQPLMAQINEKYKNDAQKKNQEIMALYKTYKVNPLGGCLPMVVQMPIFFALYQMLYSAIELRHAPFFGWITDLSAPDRLFDFGVVLPFFSTPTGIPVLTLIMGASMFIQQKMSPPAGDPAQAKMMMMMPIFMTIIFINFSSGLVLYWLINNILSIAQQYYITRNNN